MRLGEDGDGAPSLFTDPAEVTRRDDAIRERDRLLGWAREVALTGSLNATNSVLAEAASCSPVDGPVWREILRGALAAADARLRPGRARRSA